jgi:hypothetical protein
MAASALAADRQKAALIPAARRPCLDPRKRRAPAPGRFRHKVIRDLRRTANFESLYQQNVGPAKRRKIKPKHFGTFSTEELPVGPVVLSVDPGFDSGDENSYTVVQAWVKNGTRHYLIDQWRAQADYDELEKRSGSSAGNTDRPRF